MLASGSNLNWKRSSELKMAMAVFYYLDGKILLGYLLVKELEVAVAVGIYDVDGM